MKKAAIILMGICLCLSIPVAAEAAQTGTSSVTQQSTINTTVPDTHMVTIRSEHAQVSYQHEEGDDEEGQDESGSEGRSGRLGGTSDRSESRAYSSITHKCEVRK